MDNNIQDMNLDELLAQRSNKLSNALYNYDRENSVNNSDITSSDTTDSAPDIELAELNFIRQYLDTMKANNLIERLNRLQKLKESRSFSSAMGKAAINDEERTTLYRYNTEIETSRKSTGKLEAKRLLFILLGIISLCAALLLFMGGIIIVAIILLIIGLALFGSLGDIKEEIHDIKAAKEAVKVASKIAKIENNTIIFINQK